MCPDKETTFDGIGANMRYRFARCQTHPKCPDVIGWYLVLEPSDPDTLMEVHKGVANLYYFKFGMDPHITESEMADTYNPIRLTASWLQTVEKLLWEGSIVINSHGGCLRLDEVKIVSELTSEKLIWPDYYDDEIITISRWPEAHHFYLSSNKDRIFVPSKFHDYEDAHRMASLYTENIRSKNC